MGEVGSHNDGDGDGNVSRLGSELELLQAMYPDPATVSYDPRSGELRYNHVHYEADAAVTSTLVLRLPDNYPVTGRPGVLLSSATVGSGGGGAAQKPKQRDLRSAAASMIQGLYDRGELEEGIEALDAVLLAFQDLLASLDKVEEESSIASLREEAGEQSQKQKKRKTVVIWLHHLLNTNKRKLALNPSLVLVSDDDDGTISGVTKPGYPGVLVYTGPKAMVDAHVAELRAQRWQAFQVRFDSEDVASGKTSDEEMSWEITAWDDEGGEAKNVNNSGSRSNSNSSGGSRIREVESMSQVVQSLARPADRDTFLRVMGIK